MTVGNITSIDYSQWNKNFNANNDTSKEVQKEYAQYNTAYMNDQYISKSGETCTDGKDDVKSDFGVH